MLNGTEWVHIPLGCTDIVARLPEAVNQYKANDRESFKDHSLTPRHYISSILAPIYLKIVVDVAAYSKICR